MSPQRIVSVVPSQTELLYDLGLDIEVVGITKFCIHPVHWFRTKKRVGGTKKLNLELIDELKPNLILANYEENTKEDIEQLQLKYDVYISDIKKYNDALQMIIDVGNLVGKLNEAKTIIEIIEQEAKQYKTNFSAKKALYLIWQNPYMLAGNDTFIHSMMSKIGLENVIQQARYPTLTVNEMIDLNPEIIVLSSEPFPFKQKHVLEMRAIFPNAKVVCVDGEMFSWYGSRMKYSFNYFKQIEF
jgi:ABC-type Fe3+-hydroxamate transport system substrate-binding protein